MSHKHLFSKALAAAPDRLHFAAHSHHLWPNVAIDAHAQAAADALTLADHKWDKVIGEILPAARAHIARELHLSDPTSIAFAPNTHEFITRMRSCFPSQRPLRILTSDGEFHSLSRQLKRWLETGEAVATIVSVEPFDTFFTRFCSQITAQSAAFDWVFVSQVFFNSGHALDQQTLHALAQHLNQHPNTWLIIDGYHGFMGVPTDLSAIESRAFYLSGGYKYAMAGEGACFLHAPAGYGEKPSNTGWFAAFEALEAHGSDAVPYATHAGRFTGATFDPSGLYRFVAVQDMLAQEQLTTQAMSAHVHTLQRTFHHHISTANAGALTRAHPINPPETDTDTDPPASATTTTPPTAPTPNARFLAFRHPDAAQWCAALAKAGVVTDVRGDVIRFGFALYHDTSDVDALAQSCATHLS